jgi:predicted methyltransferase
MRCLNLAIAAVLVAAPISVVAQPAANPATEAVVDASASNRTADNVKLDESRKPAEVLQFLGLKPGDQVLDLFGANKYWSEIIAPAVAPNGHVTVWNPTQFLSKEDSAAFETFASKQKNVDLISSPFEAPNLPVGKFDFAMLNLNYHDVYWQNEKYGVVKMDPAAWLKTLNAAMKVGGIVGVIDHVANANDDVRATVDKLHRIDPDVVKRDFEKAGFELVASSDLLRNPADDHALLVFDPKIRGKTDRFIFKFRKVR